MLQLVFQLLLACITNPNELGFKSRDPCDDVVNIGEDVLHVSLAHGDAIETLERSDFGQDVAIMLGNCRDSHHSYGKEDLHVKGGRRERSVSVDWEARGYLPRDDSRQLEATQELVAKTPRKHEVSPCHPLSCRRWPSSRFSQALSSLQSSLS